MEKNWQIITSKASLNPRRRENIASAKRISSKQEWGALILLSQLSFWCLWLEFYLLLSCSWEDSQEWNVHSVESSSFSLSSVIRICKEWFCSHSLQCGVILLSYCNYIWIQEENFDFLYFWRKATVHVPCG